ncbi:hypothetical protein [Chishuiella sp.]|uniref:hypothetical protein n=1 Tax=Chishuiella sp. TaxID=1969467 RepID=UPI0028AE3421|nr:hypothetical protein [Chishuiella sp.]
MNKEIKIATWVLLFGGILLILAPYFLSKESCFGTFNESTGVIGDTIGGITAPISNIIGAILVYLALKAQVKANEIVQKQIDRQEAKDSKRNISEQLHRLYSTLEDNIKSYTFKGFNSDYNYDDTEHKEYKGSDGIHKFFRTIICDFHQTPETLLETTCVTELLSIIKVCNILLQKLNKSNIDDKDLLFNFTKHQFEYKIMPALKNLDEEALNPYFCEDCKCNHGIPEILLNEINEIKNQLKL